jgi:hypothetical protein
MPLVILHHLLNVSVQLANKRGLKKIARKQKFRNLDLFPSSGDGKGTPTLLDSSERAKLNHCIYSLCLDSSHCD